MPRQPFTFDHGTRRGKKLAANLVAIGAVPTPTWRVPKPKCQAGRTINTLPALVAYLEAQPSVWFATAGKPMPSTVLLNWQMRQVLAYLRAGRFCKVVRP